MKTPSNIRTAFAAVTIGVLVAVTSASFAGSHSGMTVPAAASVPAPAPMTGIFTGELVNGAPIYKLPAINVSANRKTELAKMAAEDKIARARRHHAKVVAHSQSGDPGNGNSTLAANVQHRAPQ